MDETEPMWKKWSHIPVRPKTFEEFRRLKEMKYGEENVSDNNFVKLLIEVYKAHRRIKE